jgi:DNA-binding NtrC family response regulator
VALMSEARRVLVVDDDSDFGESLLDILELHRFEGVTAATAGEAIAALSPFDPPIAMIDIRLGGASGVDLISALRDRRPGLVCVMMTAHVDTPTAIEAMRRGAYDYIDKSCEPGELVAVLERAFETHQLREEKRMVVEALRHAKEAAESANRAKSAFLATMSHELRTPLNAIIGFSEMILSETLGKLENRHYRDYIKDIRNSGQHLLEIINDILDLTKA